MTRDMTGRRMTRRPPRSKRLQPQVATATEPAVVSRFTVARSGADGDLRVTRARCGNSATRRDCESGWSCYVVAFDISHAAPASSSDAGISSDMVLHTVRYGAIMLCADESEFEALCTDVASAGAKASHDSRSAIHCCVAAARSTVIAASWMTWWTMPTNRS